MACKSQLSSAVGSLQRRDRCGTYVYMARLHSIGYNRMVVILLIVAITNLSIQAEQHGCLDRCVNGNCDTHGQCVCDPCWHGDDCDRFKDSHGARFVEKHTNIYITSEQAQIVKNIIYTLKAVDDDGQQECKFSKKTCRCAQIKYHLGDTLHADYFSLDDTSGQLSIHKVLSDEEEYQLEALASSGDHPPAVQRLTIKVQHELTRLKRQAKKSSKAGKPESAPSSASSKAQGDTEPIIFGLRTISGEVNSLKVGDSIHYRLEMGMPRATIAGLVLEIFTRDSYSGTKSTPSLSLYNFTIPAKAASISYVNPEPKYFLSNQSRNVFDRVFVDFGQVKNTGPDRNPLTIHFSVILTRNKGPKGDQKHAVTIGTEYNRGSFAWVAQSQITTSPSNDDQVFSDVTFPKLPSKLNLDSAALIQIESNLEFRSDQFRLVVSRAPAEYEPDNLVSFGKISIVHFGRNYQAIPNTASHYDSSLSRPNRSLAFTTSTLDMGVIANVGEKGRSLSGSPHNILSFVLPVYALNYPENVGKNVSFSVAFYLGSKSFMSKTINMTIDDRLNTRTVTKLVASRGDVSSRSVAKGGLTQLDVASSFGESDAFVDYVLEVDVPFVSGHPALVACAARLDQAASGFNLAYLNEALVKPVAVNDERTYQFNFGRIQFIVQRNQSREEDNRIHSIVTLRIASDHNLEVGTTHNFTVRAFSGSKTIKVAINDSEITIAEPETNVLQLGAKETEDNETMTEEESPKPEQPSFAVKVERSVPWEGVMLGGGVAGKIEIDIPSGAAYQNFEARLRRAPAETAPHFGELNICKLRVLRIGPNLPCSCVQVDDINTNRTIYTHNKRNKTQDARLDFGAISVVSDASAQNWQRRLLLNFATMLTGESELSMQPLAMLLELTADGKLLWSQPLNYNVADREVLPDASRNAQPEVDIAVMDRSIAPGFTSNLRIKLVTQASTISPLMIEVRAEDRELSICGLWIHSVGENMPCIDKALKAHYEPESGVARLELDALTNFGSPLRVSSEAEKLANTIELRAMIRVSEKAKSNKTLVVHVAYGERKVPIEHIVPMPVDLTTKAPSTFREPKVINLTDGAPTKGWAFAGVPKLVYYDIELEENSQTPISLLLEGANDFRVCSAAFVHVGRNYPCYSTQNLKLADSRIELNMVCNTFLHDNVEDNRMKLGVAIRPNTRVATPEIFMSSFAYIGSMPFKNRIELTFSVREDFDSPDLAALSEGKGATVQADEKDTILIKIRQPEWITFWVKIPTGTAGMLAIEARGEADETRAVVVLHDMRLVSGGANIPCAMEGFGSTLNLIKNVTVSTSQTNVLKSELGYFANFGLGSKRGGTRNETERRQEDSLRVEVLAELSDHPAVVDGGVYELVLTTFYGSQTNESQPAVREGRAKLMPIFEGEPNPQIDATIRMKKRKQLEILDRGDKLQLTAVLRHHKDSNAEPLNVALRLFMPDFVQVVRIDDASTKEKPTLNNDTEGIADIVFPWILFSDEIVVNFTIQMDPENRRGFGHPETVLITPYRVLCEHARLTNNLARQPCSAVKHVRFGGKSSECQQPLGMESKEIKDNQISASSAVSADFAPTYARINSDKYWAPAMPDVATAGDKHYLQIDFLRKTRVVRLSFKSIKGLKRVAKFRLCSSRDGRAFDCDSKPEVIFWDVSKGVGEAKLNKPQETRFIRMMIDDVEVTTSVTRKKGKKKDPPASSDGYVAVRVEFHGCYLEDTPADQKSLVTSKTHFTDDPRVKNRLIAIDPYTNVLFFCDAFTSEPGPCQPSKQNDVEQMCYHSITGGEHWNVIARSIDSIEGFELASGKFYAIDYARPAYFTTSNGVLWRPITFEEFNATVTHSKFQKKIVVPQLSREDLRKANIKLGGWRVAYEGLFYEDNQHPKTFWRGCCLADS